MNKSTIACLGNGITANAVLKKAKDLGVNVGSVDEADQIITSPGIPPNQFPQNKDNIISEIEWAYQLFQESHTPPSLIAVTGTNGKSTVTSLISHVLDIPFAGNIGIPLIDFVGLEQIYPEIVVEVSSYQLETSTTFKPNIAVLLNVTPDHLRRHGSFDEYVKQKSKCVQMQTPDDIVVFNEDDPIVCEIASESLAEKIPFSKQDIDDDLIQACHLPGKHNLMNLAATIKVVEIMGKSKAYTLSRLQEFKGLKHRMEKVGTFNNITYINDSKSTNPDSTIKAVQSMSQPTHLMLCGEEKNVDLVEMMEEIHKSVKTITVFGEIAAQVNILSTNLDAQFPVFIAGSLSEALDHIYAQVKPNETVLFSPSSSSYDCFKGFEDRGNQFCLSVTQYYESLSY